MPGKLADRVQSNPKLKILYIPPRALKVFLSKALQNPKVEMHLEELELVFETDQENFDNEIMNFIESQRNSLKYLRLKGCRIGKDFAKRMLLLNLVRLVMRDCTIQLVFIRHIARGSERFQPTFFVETAEFGLKNLFDNARVLS